MSKKPQRSYLGVLSIAGVLLIMIVMTAIRDTTNRYAEAGVPSATATNRPASTATGTSTTTSSPTATLSQDQVIETAVGLHFTQTAQAQLTLTAAAGFQATVGNIILQTNVARGTPFPTNNTPSLTPTTTSTPTATSTLSQDQIVASLVSQHLTQTAQYQATNNSGTAIQATVNSIIQQTNAANGTFVPSNTPTPDPTSNVTLSYDQAVGTAVQQKFTQTAQAQATLSSGTVFQQTVSANVNQLLTQTATNMPSSTLTPTLNSTDQQATLNAIIMKTIQAQQTATAGSALQSTIAANINVYNTATAQAFHAALVQGLQPITVENASSLKTVDTLKAHTASVSSLDTNLNGTQLVSGGEDFSLIVWDVLSGKQVANTPGFSKRYAVAFAPDGIHIGSGNADGTLRIWDSQANKEQIVAKSNGAIVITSVAFSPDGLVIAAGSTDGLVRTWDSKTGAPQLTLRGHSGAVTSVKYSPDGLRLISAGTDGSIRLWEAKTGNRLGLFSGDRITKIAISPDGSLIASASFDTTVSLWDVQKGTLKAILNGHTNTVNSVSFSPDGTLLASASLDGTVRIWNVQKGALLVALQGHSGGVNDVLFSPDGARLMSAGQDNTIRIWAIPNNP
jgi:WD40 repeat protein